jgi:hypothetical protein
MTEEGGEDRTAGYPTYRLIRPTAAVRVFRHGIFKNQLCRGS